MARSVSMNEIEWWWWWRHVLCCLVLAVVLAPGSSALFACGCRQR